MTTTQHPTHTLSGLRCTRCGRGALTAAMLAPCRGADEAVVVPRFSVDWFASNKGLSA